MLVGRKSPNNLDVERMEEVLKYSLTRTCLPPLPPPPPPESTSHLSLRPMPPRPMKYFLAKKAMEARSAEPPRVSRTGYMTLRAVSGVNTAVLRFRSL